MSARLKAERFEDLVAWQKARLVTESVYQLTRQAGLAADRGLSTQLQRASVSVMANLAEGFERGGRAEFQHFVSIAKASAAEVRSLLYVALDASYIDEAAFDDLMADSEELARILGGLRKALARQRTDQRSNP